MATAILHSSQKIMESFKIGRLHHELYRLVHSISHSHKSLFYRRYVHKYVRKGITCNTEVAFQLIIEYRYHSSKLRLLYANSAKINKSFNTLSYMHSSINSLIIRIIRGGPSPPPCNDPNQTNQTSFLTL